MTSEVKMLGPLQVCLGARVAAVKGPKLMIVLATLAASANRVVSADRLVEALWGDHPPRSAEHAVQQHISVLRKQLVAAGLDDDVDGLLVTRAPGYCLHVGRSDTDEWEMLRAEGMRALADHRSTDAIAAFDSGLRLWRGDAFEGIEESSVIDAARVRLEEQRLAVLEARARALLDTGRAAEAVSDLESLVRLHPTREALWASLMLALYRNGRQADALGAYQSAREALVDGLGLEPSAALRDLETAILQQRPSLDAAPGHTPPADELVTTFLPDDPTEVGTVVLQDGQKVRLRSGTIVIGRDPSVQVRLVDSQVSRRHAAIEVTEHECTLRDLGSSNGTSVNGERVDTHDLRDGDVIGLGGVRLTFQLTR